ncbi:MAG TPA: hypothetical protein V6D08_11885 [Candidatus Obscuribacterales bacterium]
MAEENRRLNPDRAWLLALILICLLFGLWLGAAYVSYELQEHPIHAIDPKAQYVWIGDLLPRNQWAESAIVGLGFGLGFSCFVGAIYLIAKKPFGAGWLKKSAIASIMIGVSPALLFATWLGYSAYLGEIRDWGKTHDAFVYSQYLFESLSLPAILGGIIAAVVAVVAFAVAAVVAFTAKHIAART